MTGLETNALIAAGVILAVGVALAVGLKRIGIQDGATFIALLVLPLLVYGVGSGVVSEFTAPGGWGGKFREVAAKPAEATPLAVGAEAEFEQFSRAEFERFEIVEKSSLAALEQRRSSLKPGQPVAMTFVLGRSGYYNRYASTLYARTLISIDSGLTVIFVDSEGRFVASASGTSMLAGLESEEQGEALIGAIGGGNLDRVAELVGLNLASVAAGTSNAATLDQMLRNGVTTLIAVDDTRRPVGIVRRDDIVASMLVKLAAQ